MPIYDVSLTMEADSEVALKKKLEDIGAADIYITDLTPPDDEEDED